MGSAAQALSLIKAEPFDLYMLDSRLPEVDGYELCRRMRVFDPHTPILFFSGAAYETDKRKAIEAGADAYVVKPNIHELVGSIKQFTSHVAARNLVRAIPCTEVMPVSALPIQGFWDRLIPHLVQGKHPSSRDESARSGRKAVRTVPGPRGTIVAVCDNAHSVFFGLFLKALT